MEEEEAAEGAARGDLEDTAHAYEDEEGDEEEGEECSHEEDAPASHRPTDQRRMTGWYGGGGGGDDDEHATAFEAGDQSRTSMKARNPEERAREESREEMFGVPGHALGHLGKTGAKRFRTLEPCACAAPAGGMHAAPVPRPTRAVWTSPDTRGPAAAGHFAIGGHGPAWEEGAGAGAASSSGPSLLEQLQQQARPY